MYFGPQGELISEKDPVGDPGRLGDSCHNTARHLHLQQLLVTLKSKPAAASFGSILEWNGEAWIYVTSSEVIKIFITSKGYIRHPDVPDDWKESDTPNDLLIPLLIALESYNHWGAANQMRDRIKANGWRCGNGDLVNPILFALIKRSKWLLNLALIGHAILSYQPIRWSDEHKRLEWDTKASADFINWAHACWHIKSPAFHLVSHKRFMEKIEGYFASEPNSLWIVEMYREVSVLMRRQ